MSPQLVGLGLPDREESWLEAGFTVRDRCVTVGSMRVELGCDVGWSFDPPTEGSIDRIQARPIRPAPGSEVTNPNGANAVDHLVVATPNLDRTTTAFEAHGIPLRKARPIGDREQRFFWAGKTIIELVGPIGRSGHGPATIWGIALVADDLDASKELLGDRLSEPRDAVQPGRQISAIRTRELNISITIALMTPHVKQA